MQVFAFGVQHIKSSLRRDTATVAQGNDMIGVLK